MNWLHNLLAWYLGLRVPGPGEGTEWRFDWHPPAPQWMLALCAIGAFLMVSLVYRRDGEALSVGKRVLLTGLRLAILLLIATALFELSLTVERTGLPSVAVIIDVSASMSLKDQYPEASEAARSMKAIMREPGRDGHRLDLAKDVLTRDDGQFLRDLQRNHRVKLYRFSDTAVPLETSDLEETSSAIMSIPLPSLTEETSSAEGEPTEKEAAPGAASGADGETKGTSGESAPSSAAGEAQPVATKRSPFEAALAEIKGLRADGDQTRPAPAVRKVLSDLRGGAPPALIVFTDGVASVSETDKLSTLADWARRRGVQLHLVGIGSDDAAKDVQLYDTQVDEVAFVGDPMLFAAKLKSFGYAGKKLTLRLRKEGEPAVLAAQEITAPPDDQVTRVELSYTSSTAGEFDLRLEVVPQTDETNRENNGEVRHVSVREEKIRVLLVEGVPRYEFRYLKQLFERDKSIELGTLLLDADLDYALEDKTALQRFPVKKEDLARYDALVIGDILTTQLGAAELENVRDFVREKGGSIVFIAGPASNPSAFGGTPLEALLPFELVNVKVPADGAAPDSFHPRLTIEGLKGNSLFRFGNSEAESQRIWNGLPNLFWQLEIQKTKPGVRVFAEHPVKSGPNGPLPTILLQQVGAGKVLYHATDETWRWRYRTGDLHFGRYWIQAIRYLSRGRLIGKDRTAELSVDQLVYQRGQPVNLRVRFVDEKYIPTDPNGVTVTLERKGEGRQTLKLARLREAATIFEGQVPRLAEGTYHAWVSQPAFNEAPPATDFRVEIPQRELQRRGMDRADLQQAAKLSNGRLYTLDDVGQLPGEIPRGVPVPLQTDEPIPLWNRWELLTLVASLMALEWLLRKRFKLV